MTTELTRDRGTDCHARLGLEFCKGCTLAPSAARGALLYKGSGSPRWRLRIQGEWSMLVLSRGRNDKVVFPTLGISVEILRVAGNKVRLGIEAPHEVPVHRHEISERIAKN